MRGKRLMPRRTRVRKPVLVALFAIVLVGGFASGSGPSSAAAPGLVLALGFDESSGTSVADASGTGNNGSTANTSWAMGKYGSALSFNGSSSRVTIPDTASLHLTNAMTLEAWVEKTATNANWRDVIYKGNDNYYLESSSSPGNRPAGGATIGATSAETFGTATLATNTWAHLAVTYDGNAVLLYVNGSQVASTPKTGSITTSTNPLTIGSDSFYGQYFQGLIDEVRVYNVALTAAQIQSDMNTPINAPSSDTTPPSAPGTLTATASGSTQINLNWGAATDNVGVTGYRIERCQGASCSNFTQIAAPTGTATTYTDSGLAAATSYSYRVRATDAAGNLGSYTNTANATTQTAADTTPPSAPGTLRPPPRGRRRSTSTGARQPTTSASPATASNAAKAPAAATSPRSPHPPAPPPPTPTADSPPPPATATASAPPTPPATSAATPTPPTPPPKPLPTRHRRRRQGRSPPPPRARRRSTSTGARQPTTSASPATASNAAKAPAAATSPRSPHPPAPPPPTPTPASPPPPATATASAPPTPPATSAATPTPPTPPPKPLPTRPRRRRPAR